MGRNRIPTDTMTEYIKARILAGGFRTGEPLPSVRRLALKFKLSYGTAYRAMERLCEEGWLQKNSGYGFCVRSAPPEDEYGIRVSVLMERMMQNSDANFLCYHILLGLRQAAVGRGCFFKPCYLNVDELNDRLLQETISGSGALVFTGGYDHVLKETMLPCPAVGVMMLNTYGGQVSTVNLDPFDTVRQAIAFFARRMLLRVVVISSPRPYYVALGKLFRTLFSDHGGYAELQIGVPDENMRYERGVGYFFTSDHMLLTAANIYRRRFGGDLAAEFVVLGADGKRLLNPESPHFPTIAVDWKNIGYAAFDELRRRLDDAESPARGQLLCGTLVE